MILPIITSVSREVFRQTPIPHIEAAQALGATKWEVVRMTVLPYGRSGVIAASMLGLGRALGETVAVLIILRAAAIPGHWSLFDGGYTFASKIASAAAEFSAPLPTGAYIAAGFVLFALTFVVNATARVHRRWKGQRMNAATLDQPVKGPDLPPGRSWQADQEQRRHGVVRLSFGIALIPLVWVLYVVDREGLARRHEIGLVDPVAARACYPNRSPAVSITRSTARSSKPGSPLSSRSRWA